MKESYNLIGLKHWEIEKSFKFILVWVLRDFRAIRLVTSKCLVILFLYIIKLRKNIGANFLFAC